MGKFIDMTGWVMSEHGVPDSRLTVIKRVENYVSPKTGYQSARFLCECSCVEHNQIIAVGSDIRNGHTKSCGCLDRETTAAINKGKRIGNINGFCGDIGRKWLIATNCHKVVYYDADDANLIEQYTWFIDHRGYAATNIDSKIVCMHQLIGCNRYDHKDRNPLNNCKDNLRPATYQENGRNSKMQTNNTSGIIGVSWHSGKEKWCAYIHFNNQKKYLGDFINKNDAIVARLEAEAKYYGEFAPQRHLFEEYGIINNGQHFIQNGINGGR